MITKEKYEEAQRIVREYEAQNQPKPPKIVQAPEECESYLTPGKNYEVVGIWVPDFPDIFGMGLIIIDDDGGKIDSLEKKSSHLNGGDWIIIEREP